MNKEVLKQLSDQLQRERRALIEEVSNNNQALRAISEAREPEIEEEAQQERDSRALERLDQRQHGRLRDIDEALARIEASTYGTCANCRKPIEEDRLRFRISCLTSRASSLSSAFPRECVRARDGQGDIPRRGWESQSAVAPSLLTERADRAAARNR